MKISPLRECNNCHNGVGKDTYQSPALSGEYCSMDCYSEALCEITGGMKGKFKMKTDGAGGVELV